MVRMAGPDEDGLDGPRFRESHNGDEAVFGPDDDDLGAWLSGLDSTERATVDRAAREREIDEGRVQLGRDARAHPRALPEGADGGLVDGDAVLDSLIVAAKSFEQEYTEAAIRERELLRDALDRSIMLGATRPEPDPDVAEFHAYIPNGGIKTNRDNEWVVTLHVAWNARHEISRVVETIPMDVKVVLTRGQG